jgi:hypothetical protein
MKRKTSAILLLTVFVSLQFGKVANYIYCKWQAEIVQNKDCGCEDHLTSMFAHNDDAGTTNDLSKININEKLNEFTPKQFVDLTMIIFKSENSFAEYNSSLSNSFLPSPFHPPIA